MFGLSHSYLCHSNTCLFMVVMMFVSVSYLSEEQTLHDKQQSLIGLHRFTRYRQPLKLTHLNQFLSLPLETLSFHSFVRMNQLISLES